MGQTILIMQQLVDRHFLPMLNILPQFKSWTVLVPTQKHSDGIPTIRIVLYFGEDADPSLMLSQLGLPIKLEQLVQRFRLRLQMSRSLVDILGNKRMILNDIGLRASISAHVNRAALSTIIDEAAYRCLSEVDEREIELEMLAQTKTANLNQDKTTKDWAEIDFERREAACRKNCERWLQIARWIRYAETVESTLSFDSLRDFFTHSAFVHHYSSSRLSELLLNNLDAPGKVKRWWSDFIKSIESEMMDIACDLPKSGDFNCDQEIIAAYSALRKTFLGLYSIRAEMGTCSLTLQLDGFDIMEVLPDLHPTTIDEVG